MSFTLLFRYLSSIGLLTFVLLGCATSSTNKHDTEIIVASERVDCIDEIPQKCYLIKPKNNANLGGFDDQWYYFFGNFAGFDHEEGTEYRLLVGHEEKQYSVEEGNNGNISVKRVLKKSNQRSKDIPETLHYSVRRK